MRQPEPFFRPKKNRWYVQLDGKQINLGPTEAGAFAGYHRIMSERSNPRPQIVNSDGTVYVASVVDAIVAWLKSEVASGSKAQRTLDWYVDYLTSFLRYLRSVECPGEPGEAPSITIDKLEPYHVYQWLDSEPGWKAGRRGAMTAAQCAFNWAAKAGILKTIGGKSPLSTLQKPPKGRREQLVTEPEYCEVVAHASDQEFTDLLELSWETGCRRHELFTLEAVFVNRGNARWIFPVKHSKGKKVQRVVYLDDRALEITERLIRKQPTGPLLRNTDGIAWCVSSVKCRFQHICRQIGRDRLRKFGLIPKQIPRLKVIERTDPEVRAAREKKFWRDGSR